MKLLDLHESKAGVLAKKTLKESFNMKFDADALTASQTRKMLVKIRGLLSEVRSGNKYHESHRNPQYMKLLMLEQVLSAHLKNANAKYKIVVENEEVQKSQVILAAQDMIDTVQKMVEQISKMNVEELPAVVQGIENEIGVSESEQFSSSVGENLKTLLSALENSRNELNKSLGSLTGQAPQEADLSSSMSDLESPDMTSPENQLPDMSSELPELPEEPEEIPGNLGRGRR